MHLDAREVRGLDEARAEHPQRPLTLGNLQCVEPFERQQVREENGERVISYGNSSYGYDVRLSEEFKLFTNINSAVIDPKRFDEKCLIDAELKVDPNGDKYVILPRTPICSDAQSNTSVSRGM